MIETRAIVPPPTVEHGDCPSCSSLEDDPDFVASILAAAEDVSEPMTTEEFFAWLDGRSGSNPKPK